MLPHGEPQAPVEPPGAEGTCRPTPSLALTRLWQDGQHVLSQAHSVEERFKLLQELGAHIWLPCCSQTPKVSEGAQQAQDSCRVPHGHARLAARGYNPHLR